MKRKKRRLSRQGAAKAIAQAVWEHLETLPTRERQKRLNSAHKFINAKIITAKVSSGRAGTHPRPQAPQGTVPMRVAARSTR